MSQWKIVPAAVRAVLLEVSGQQEGLAATFSEKDLEAIEVALSWCPEVAGYIPAALNRVMENQKENLQTVASHVNAGVVGVGNALISYEQGQREMAGNFEREMFNSAASGDFSYFDQYGYKGEE
jgi:hypothetical protein